MPYNPSGVYSLPAIYLAIPGTTIISAQHNEPLVDLQDAQNFERPIIGGGTGAGTASGARASLAVPGLATNNTYTGIQTFGAGVVVSRADPNIILTDTDTGASTQLTANSSAGSFVISVDGGAVVAGSAFGVNIDSTPMMQIRPDGAMWYGTTRIAAAGDAGTSVGISMNGSQGAIDMMRNGFATLYQRRQDASGNLQEFYRSSTTFTGAISVAGTTTTYGTSSDERLKDFVGAYDPLKAIDIIRRDPVRDFHWKEDGSYSVGWGAQTSQKVSPDLAFHDEGRDTWSIDQGKRTPYLWAALSWALDKIEELEVRLKAANL